MGDDLARGLVTASFWVGFVIGGLSVVFSGAFVAAMVVLKRWDE
jgi:hypothetical protein